MTKYYDKDIPTEIHFIYGGRYAGKTYREFEKLEEKYNKLKKDVSFKDKEIDRLEGENKKLKECYCNRTDCSGRIKDSKKYESLQQRIDKAIKYLKLKVDIPKNHLEEAIKDREEDLLKILKGEEND